MSRLFRFELRKLFRKPSFYICLAVLAGLTFMSIYSTYALSKLFLNEAGIELAPSALAGLGGVTAADQLRRALGSSNVTLILGIFTALFICSDYMEGTAKNIIGRGYTRSAWLTAKLGTVLIAAAVFAVVCLAVTFAASVSFFGTGDIKKAGLFPAIPLQLLLILAHAALFTLFSLLIRKNGGAIAMNLLVPSVVSLIVTLLDVLVFEEESKLAEYWLPNVLSEASQAGTSDPLNWLAVGLAYLAGCSALSYLLTSRQDI